LQLGVAESLDDESAKIAHGTVDHLSRETKEDAEPGLGIGQSLNYLVPLDLSVLDSGLVRAEPPDSKRLLIVGEPFTIDTLAIMIWLLSFPVEYERVGRVVCNHEPQNYSP
jgi:hypothetical protein